jgi:protein SCO1/2
MCRSIFWWDLVRKATGRFSPLFPLMRDNLRLLFSSRLQRGTKNVAFSFLLRFRFLTGIFITWFFILAGLNLAGSTLQPAPNQLPEAVRDVGIDQRLNEQVPLDLVFQDEYGKAVKLGDYFHERPVILTLVYHECPMLCSEVLDGLLRTMRVLKFNIGKDFDVVTVSFNPEEDATIARSVKETYLKRYKREGAEEGWHFLTGEQASIEKLTKAVGFRYGYDPAKKLYIHAAGIMLVTPQGRLSRYFYGIEFPAKDLRLGLVEASQNKIGSVVDQVLLYCYHYDPATGTYGLVIMTILRILGITFVLGMGLYIILMLRRERGTKYLVSR